MILHPPFYLSGTAGATLGAEGYQLAALGITDAVLSLRSLDADSLQFSLRDNGNRPSIPDDGQWLTLSDDSGQVLFTGIAKRSFAYPARVYSYEVTNVYQGMLETPLLGSDGRPFLLYEMDELQDRIRDILTRASNAGLPFQAPAAEDMPALYLAPKMAFRSASYASALEDVLKWVPDVVSFTDYSTSPPTLRFRCRSQSTAATIDLDSDGHKATSIQLTALPEARALGVSMAYSRRDGDKLFTEIVQSAGDMSAEAARKISIYLSGSERSDMLTAEALTSAQLAILKINQLITATGASVEAAAASAGLTLSWATCLERDSNLLAATTAQSGFTMAPAGGASYYETISTSYTGASDAMDSYYGQTLYLATATGTAATGWYAIKTGAFTAEQLATAGAIKETRYIRGQLQANRAGSTGRNVGMQSLWDAAPSQCNFINGYSSNYYNPAFSSVSDYARASLWYRVNLAVDAINMSPTAVAAAVTAAAGGTDASSFITRAEFVDPPPDLAANYFARQDWTPYKGTLSLAPSVSNIPMPGDFLNIAGTGTPAEWATMAAPVAETEIGLRTGAPRITIGPSPRQDFRSLVDRLRIPAEDNYQAG